MQEKIERGMFIVVEGLEGAGKTTVIDSMTTFLKQRGISHLKTNEPNEVDEFCGGIRAILKKKTATKLVKEAECLLFYAARAQSVATIVEPALGNGVWVVCDRHDWSTLAYQGFGCGVPLSNLAILRELSIGKIEPDFTIYIDIEPKLGISRARERGALDRIEERDLSFFNAARRGFKELVSANSETSVMIDGSKSKEEVAISVCDALAHFFKL